MHPQHDARPTSCAAKVCKCPKGRDYQVDIENHKHSMEYCDCCGSVAVHLRCFVGKKFCCDECQVVVARREALPAISKQANGIASSSSGNFMVTDSNADMSEKLRKIVSKFDIRDCSVPLLRLKAEDFGSTSKQNYQKYIQLGLIKQQAEKRTKSTTNITKRANASSDENQIQPVIRKSTSGKIDNYFVRVIDSDSDIEISPVIISSSSDSDCKDDVASMNAEQTKPNTTVTIATGRMIERKASSSEDESNRPSVIIRNSFHQSVTDNLMAGKENEKPVKTVAVVRPFLIPSESSCGKQNIHLKTEKYPGAVSHTSSSSGIADDSSNKSTITQRYDYMKNIPKKEEPSAGLRSFVSTKTIISTTTTTTSTKKISTIPCGGSVDDYKRTPIKRKHRSVRSYFCDSSSSGDEIEEPKPKRKSPKKSKTRSPAAHVERPPNQSSIINFFQRKLNQGI